MTEYETLNNQLAKACEDMQQIFIQDYNRCKHLILNEKDAILFYLGFESGWNSGCLKTAHSLFNLKA